jgi:hypothetical protein
VKQLTFAMPPANAGSVVDPWHDLHWSGVAA